MQRLGEAAGAAAALCVRDRVAPRQLDVRRLQEVLLRTGALGPRRPPELAAPGQAECHDASWMPPAPPALPLAERIRQLEADQPQEAAWALIRGGREAVPLLLDAVRSERPRARQWAAVALAMLRQPEAAPELRACVAERRADKADGHRAAPIWQGAACLLGRIRDRESVPVLSAVLEDRGVGLDPLIGAVRALGRIGDASAIAAVDAMLRRPDLPTERRLQVSCGDGRPAILDARWQLELAAAETLARLGRPRPDLVEPYTRDPRAFVRRYARQVAEETATAAAAADAG
jgi:HEAT repeat protein